MIQPTDQLEEEVIEEMRKAYFQEVHDSLKQYENLFDEE